MERFNSIADRGVFLARQLADWPGCLLDERTPITHLDNRHNLYFGRAESLRNEEAQVALPDFLVIGAPKAGTTALHAALAQHPGLYMSPIKEPKFFLTDGPPPTRGGPGDVQTYREHVWRAGRLRGAVRRRPARDAARRVDPAVPVRPGRDGAGSARPIPDAKLIVIVRDPVERAHSNWTHLWSAGLEPIGDFVRPAPRRSGGSRRAGPRSGTTPG